MLPKPTASQPRQRLSKASVTSLICGLVFIPFITGITALIAGVLAIRDTRDPDIIGRPWAVIGIILGLLNLVIWGSIANWYLPTIPIRRAALQYVNDIGYDRPDAALRDCTGDQRANVASEIQQLKVWGIYSDAVVQNVSSQNNPGLATATTTGFVSFTNSAIVYEFTIDLVDLDGTWKVSHFDIHR